MKKIFVRVADNFMDSKMYTHEYYWLPIFIDI